MFVLKSGMLKFIPVSSLADISMALTISLWEKYVREEPKLSKKSEMIVESNRVLKFVLDTDSQTVIGVVQSSWKDKSYEVKVSL